MNVTADCIPIFPQLQPPNFSQAFSHTTDFFFPLVFNTDWVDTHLNSTEGEDNIPGSTRSFGLEITEGIYPFTEEVSEPFPNLYVTDLTFVQLLAFNIEPDGSFIQRVGQFNIPVEYSFKNGSLSGLWVTIMQPNMRQQLIGVFMLVLLVTQSAS
jgi:hypothetical protein